MVLDGGDAGVGVGDGQQPRRGSAGVAGLGGGGTAAGGGDRRKGQSGGAEGGLRASAAAVARGAGGQEGFVGTRALADDRCRRGGGALGTLGDAASGEATAGRDG